MSGLLIKQGDRSALGLRGAWPNSGNALSHATHASLNMGLNDAIFLFLFKKVSSLTSLFAVFLNKTVGFNRYAVCQSYGNDRVTLVLGSGVGSLTVSATTVLSNGYHIYSIFANRDGNAEFYDNGIIDGTPDISSVAAINQDNAGLLTMNQNEMGHAFYSMSQPLLHYEQWFIDPANFPSAGERLQIVRQYVANPYDIPPLLNVRPNKATELRLALDFQNLDPAWNYIPDVSAYANNMSIAGGALVSACVKEFGAV
jgi:hypothetical protein